MALGLWRESDDFETILFPLSGSPIFPIWALTPNLPIISNEKTKLE